MTTADEIIRNWQQSVNQFGTATTGRIKVRQTAIMSHLEVARDGTKFRYEFASSIRVPAGEYALVLPPPGDEYYGANLDGMVIRVTRLKVVRQ